MYEVDQAPHKTKSVVISQYWLAKNERLLCSDYVVLPTIVKRPLPARGGWSVPTLKSRFVAEDVQQQADRCPALRGVDYLPVDSKECLCRRGVWHGMRGGWQAETLFALMGPWLSTGSQLC